MEERQKDVRMYIPAESEQEAEVSLPKVLETVVKVSGPLRRALADVRPGRNGQVAITPRIVKESITISRSRPGEDDSPNVYLSYDGRDFDLSGEVMSLETDSGDVRGDVARWIEFFGNYENGFKGDVPRLQRDYFTFMSWLYVSPFICDLRTLATVEGANIVHYPSFAVIYGKSNCGKTSLVDTLITSMFGHPSTVEKDGFTRRTLRGLQQNYRRFPVVFDDITRRRFTEHGLDIVKDENLPPVPEHPCFVISMNAEPQSFPDEVVKRCLMIYTNTSLPSHKHALADELHASVEGIRGRLSTDLYRRYLDDIMGRLDDEPLPKDILAFSSQTLCDLLQEHAGGALPDWCRPVSWGEYADRRYERAARRLDALLAPENFRKVAGDGEQGWSLQAGSLVVWEKADAFGRTSIRSEIPDFLYDDTSSVGDTFVLWHRQTEDFLQRRISAPGFRWPWRR